MTHENTTIMIHRGIGRFSGIDAEFYILRRDAFILSSIIDVRLNKPMKEKDKERLMRIDNAFASISRIPFLAEEIEIPGFIMLDFIMSGHSYTTAAILKLARKALRQLLLLGALAASWTSLPKYREIVASFDNDEYDRWHEWVETVLMAYESCKSVEKLLKVN